MDPRGVSCGLIGEVLVNHLQGGAVGDSLGDNGKIGALTLDGGPSVFPRPIDAGLFLLAVLDGFLTGTFSFLQVNGVDPEEALDAWEAHGLVELEVALDVGATGVGAAFKLPHSVANWRSVPEQYPESVEAIRDDVVGEKEGEADVSSGHYVEMSQIGGRCVYIKKERTCRDLVISNQNRSI